MQSSAASESDYYLRLGLTSDPFAIDAMPEFFFVGAQRRFLVQRAVHALYFSGASVLLLGSDGAGKTRTLVEIEKDLAGLADICRIDATVLMNAAEIRALLAANLGVSSAVAAGNAEFVYVLERIRPADGDPQPVLIVIDAAQLLSIETLAEIAALIAGSGGRLRLLLAGEADLFTAWQQAQAGAAEVLELKPLDRNETEDYVRTKMQAAGHREEHLLSEAQFDQLFAQSSGNFAAINVLVPQLLQPQSESPSSITHRVRAMPIMYIGAAAALLAVVIVFLLYRSDNSDSAKQVTLVQPQDIAQPFAEGKSLTNEKSLANEKSLGKEESPEKEKHNADRDTVRLQLPAPIPTLANESQATNISASVTSPTSNVVASTPVKPAVSTPPPPAENRSIEKPVTEAKPVVAKEGVPAKKIDAEKAATTDKTATPEKINAEGGSSLGADERALLAMPSSQYVLQLMGAESKTTVDKFAKGAAKGVKLFVYRTQLRGKPWFIVVTGPYADKSAVQAGLTRLPESVRKQQPWARTLVNVQADIRAHSGR